VTKLDTTVDRKFFLPELNWGIESHVKLSFCFAAVRSVRPKEHCVCRYTVHTLSRADSCHSQSNFSLNVFIL